MKDKLIDLFEYTHHFNREMISTVAGNIEKADEKILNLINHTLNAQQIWNSRILSEKTFEVWLISPFENLNDINDVNFQKSVHIIENFDLDQKIEYQNSKGIKFQNSVFEMLFQAVNHSTYHRGQINSLLKNSGIEPLQADYIFYKR